MSRTGLDCRVEWLGQTGPGRVSRTELAWVGTVRHVEMKRDGAVEAGLGSPGGNGVERTGVSARAEVGRSGMASRMEMAGTRQDLVCRHG